MSNLPIRAGAWSLDPAHSSVNFKVRHLGLSNVRGRFGQFDSQLVVGDDLASTALTASIAISSVDTNQPDRDAHLLSTDFFSADANPTIDFASRSIRESGDGDYVAQGDLTINGVTQPVDLAVEFTGSAVHPGDGKEHAGFLATTTIVRDDYGIDFNMPGGIDKLALGQKVAIEIDIQFVAPEA